MSKQSNPTTFKERDDWMRGVLLIDKKKLPDRGARLAIAIALRVNVKTGRCNPSNQTLAVDSAISKRSIARWIDFLEQKIRLIAVQRTEGRANQYTLLTRAIPMARVKRKKTSATPMAPVGTSATNRTTSATNRTTSANRAAAHNEQREQSEQGVDIPPTPCDLGAAQAQPSGAAGAGAASNLASVAPDPAPDLEDAFARFWQAVG